MRRKLSALLVIVTLGVAIGPATSSGRDDAASAGALVKVTVNKTLKQSILTDAKGRTLYLLTSDITGQPNCEKLSPKCPALWPALTSAGKPRAGAGVNARLLTTVRGAKGVRQVSYNRHPLYYYAEDRKPGDANGQACYDVWYVVSPKGRAIRTPGPRC